MRSRHFVWTLIAVCLLTVNFLLPAHAQAPNTSAPGIVPSTPLSFAPQHLGTTSEPQNVQLTNNSGAKAKLKIGTPSIPDYLKDTTDCDRELDGGQSCLLVVRFSPQVADANNDAGTARQGTVEIGYEGDDQKPSSRLTLEGTALPAFLGMAPKQIVFPKQAASATSSPQMVTLTNLQSADASGKHDITVSQITAGGDFTIDAPTLPHILKPGASLAVPVRYAPKHEGKSSGILLVTTADGNVRDIPLAGNTYDLLAGLCSFPPRQEFRFMLVVALTYWLAMIVVRWHRIAQPTRELLRAEIVTVRTELEMLPATLPIPQVPQPGQAPANPGQQQAAIVAQAQLPAGNVAQPPGSAARQRPPNWRQQIASVLDAAGLEVSPTVAHKGPLYRLANFLFWSRGQEIASWGYVHDAQEKMAAHQPEATAVAKLEVAAQQLKIASDAPSQALAQTITTALNPTQATGPDRLRALLAEALTVLNDRDDTDFAKMAGWQNKASWLVGCGLFIMLVLTRAIPHHAILFVVGGAGGLISRMSRSLNRKDVPTDYGASWTTLFLSPVSGALGAWAGILITELAIKLNVLGSAFQAYFTEPCQATTLAVALVFGFSERLLDDVLDKVDAAATTNSQPAQKSTTPATSPQAAAGQPGKLAIQQTLPKGQVNAAYKQNLQASGTVGQLTWSVTGNLPDGLQLTDPADGTISGTPKQANTFTFTASVKDANSTQSQQVTIVIAPAS